jgi:hypothetical protein
MRSLTAEEREAVKVLREQQAKDLDAFLSCRECKTRMEYVTTLAAGNDQGYGAEFLFQCPKCRRIETRDRTA